MIDFCVYRDRIPTVRFTNSSPRFYRYRPSIPDPPYMPLARATLDKLHQLLNDGEALSLDELHTTLNVSERQARRLIARLRQSGIPVQERRDGRIKRFYLEPEHRQAAVRGFEFDEEEMLALAVAAEAAKAELGSTPLEASLGRAFSKLLDELAPEAFTFEMEELPGHWHFGTPALSHIDPHVFKTLQQAINENRSVRIDYHTASTGGFSRGRKIDPLQFARYRGSWLVIAYCHTRRDLRDFSLAGIERIEPSETFFSPPDGFDPDTYFRDRFGALAGGAVYEVRLLVEPDRAAYFKRKDYHRTQMIEEKRDDGRLVVSYEVAGLQEIRSFVQSWGVGVTVLEPPELVAMVAEEARVLAGRYAKPDIKGQV